MAAGGRTENSDGPEADNVIRFPRDWFGSKEDLVPFGPAADRLEAAAAAADTGPLDDADLSDALNANDFWGEGSGALHQPVDVPDVPAPRAPAQVEPFVCAVPGPAAASSPEPAAQTIRGFEATDAPTWSRSARAPVSTRRRTELVPRRWLSGLAVAALLICAVGVFVVSRPHASPTARQALASPQVGVTPGVAVSDVADRLAVRSLGEASQATQAAQQAAQRRAQEAKRHRALEAKRAAAARRAKAARRKTVTKARAHTSPSSSASQSTSGSDTADSTAASTTSSAVSSPPVSEPAETSSASTASSSLAPGPTTAGSAGPNCDPQCR